MSRVTPILHIAKNMNANMEDVNTKKENMGTSTIVGYLKVNNISIYTHYAQNI